MSLILCKTSLLDSASENVMSALNLFSFIVKLEALPKIFAPGLSVKLDLWCAHRTGIES